MRPLRLAAVRGTFLHRAVDPDVGFAIEPPEHPDVEIVVRDELPAMEEALTDVAARPLDLPLCLRPIGTERPDSGSPSAG